MTIVRFGLKYGCSVLALATVCMAGAQFGAPEKVPLPDPGYGLYYHDAQGTPNFATRWGYHDGWVDGRHDRNHGDTSSAQEKDHYVKPPDHGDAYRRLEEERSMKLPDYIDAYGAQEKPEKPDSLPQDDEDTSRAQEKDHYMTPPNHDARSGAMRDRYIKEYRFAYARGYEHGSRL